MAEPTVKQGNKYFEPIIYTGNGTAIGGGGQAITGVDHQPDLAWIKNRDATDSHSLYDSSRGVTKQIESDDISAQTTESEGLTTFGSAGFTVGSLDQVNTNTENYVAYNWKANGGSTTTNDASSTGVGTIDSVYQANTTAGFSIVTYTGTGSAGTIRHGLSVAPSVIMVKNLSTTDAWKVYHSSMASDPETDYLVLNTTAVPVDDSTVWNDTAPTSSVFSIGTHTDVNTNTENYVAYCWHEVDGFSKFNSYNGNNNADGSFIATGFKPSLVICKGLTTATGWTVWDSARSPINPIDKALFWDTTGADDTGNTIDFLSNGFKLRSTNADFNGSYSYGYLSFAEHPFVGDGTNPVTAR